MSQPVSIELSIKALDRRKLVLADANPRTRGETGRYLRSIGLKVEEASDSNDAEHLLTSTVPDLLCLDLDLPGDIHRVLRIAGEDRNGHRTRVLVTCRPRTSRSRLLTLLASHLAVSAAPDASASGWNGSGGGVAAVVITPCRPEVLIDRLARVLTAGRRDADGSADESGRPGNAWAQPNPSAHPAGIALVPGCNSLLVQPVFCPFHDKPVATNRYALRLGRIETDADFFDVPVYKQAVGGADYIDYHRCCVTVCPECFFASPDPAYFLAPNDKKHTPRPVTPAARYAVISRAHQRKELAGPIPPEFFTEQRSPEDAVRSLELALHSSTTLHNVARHAFPDEKLRQGNYHLRIANLQTRIGGLRRSVDDHLDQAGTLLREAFATLPESALPRTGYQVVATHIYFGQDREAHQYLTSLNKLAKVSADPAVKASLDRYLHRGITAWEDREQHRRPPLPAALENAPFLSAA